MISKKMIGAALLLMLISFALHGPRTVTAAEVIERVVAIVNNDVITSSELTELARSLNPTSTEEIDEKLILQQMIDQKLLEQEAERLGIRVSDAEVDASLEAVKRQYNLNDEQLAEVLKKQNLTPEGFREQWKTQTLGNKLLDAQLKGALVVTQDEINKYYEENYGALPEGERSQEVKIAHILISAETPDAKAKAEEVASLAASGKNFGELVKQYSDDTLSTENGGDLGTFKKGDLIKEMEDAVAVTAVGNTAGPVQTPAGYHIIKVISRNDTGEVTTAIDEQTYQEIRQILYREKAETLLKDWLDGIKERAYIDIRL